MGQMNLFDIPEDSPEDTSENQWCIDHRLYTREPSEDEPSDDEPSQDEPSQDETSQAEPSEEGESTFVKLPGENSLR